MKFPKKMLVWMLSASMLCSLSGVTALAEEADAGITPENYVEEPVSEEPVSEEPVSEEPAAEETDVAETAQGESEAGDADEEEATDEGIAPQAEEDDANALPESGHPYENQCDNTWSYTAENAANGVIVTFDDQTSVESNYDFIYIYDGDDNQIGKYTGTELAGAFVYVPAGTVKIRLTSDRSGNDYGFKVTGIDVCGDTIDLSRVGSVDDVSPVAVGGSISPVVRLNGNALEAGTDYTVEYSTSLTGNQTAVITGIGKYSGTMNVDFFVYDDENLAESPAVSTKNVLLRQSGNTGTSYISFDKVTAAWSDVIESVTLKPVDQDGKTTDTGNAVYPKAPKEITLSAEEISVNGNNIYFNRTAENPVVYVLEGHEPVEIAGRWSTVTYPQSQTYEVTVKARGYKDAVGKMTYYTGTAPAFSIIVDEDGSADTTEDQTVVKSWSSEEIAEMAEFANGSSQCGMTGFRTFSGDGVSLNDLLEKAGVEVSDSDYFLLDTSDHYGNNFTYDQLFGTTRYFLSSIYDESFADFYDSLVDSDDDAGSTIALRRYLAEQCIANESTIEPRINVNYVESLIAGSSLREAKLPSEENISYNSLVAYENQFRFFYGIALTQDECTVTFDSQGGSEVAEQTVLSHLMTSTENTTIKSSYMANSLVVYRGAGEQYKTQPSDAAARISVPEAPTRDGYVFAGWYTDEECTDGNKFDFTADGGTVDVDTTLYAKWVEEEKAVTVTDFDITNAEHDDADEELNQTIIVTITFSDDIELTSDDLSEDLLVTIAGQDVRETARDITYEVKNGNQLVIKMVSTDWVAIYSGVLGVKESTAGISHIVAADDKDKVIVLSDQQDNIPIGIVVENDAVAGTDTVPAGTYVSVAHKANMRGMYFFQLVSIVDGKETVIGQSVSHAHAFYTSIDEAAIAGAMANAVNGFDGYSTVYTEGDTFFVVKADNTVSGETLAVRMVENKAAVNYGHAPAAKPVIENKVDATETTDGSYDLVTYCSFCGEELNRETVIVPATGIQNPGKDDVQGTGGNGQNTDSNNQGTGDNVSSANGQTGSTGRQPEKNTNIGKPVSVKTGDTANAGIWAVVFAACAGAVAVAVSRKRRGNVR